MWLSHGWVGEEVKAACHRLRWSGFCRGLLQAVWFLAALLAAGYWEGPNQGWYWGKAGGSAVTSRNTMEETRGSRNRVLP